MTETNSIHQESIEFITNNINAKTCEIPKHFLEYWYTSKEVANYFEGSTNLSSFFIFQHAFDTYNKTLGREIKHSPLDSMAMFGQFQILIGVVLGKEPQSACAPIDLFDFDNYSKLNITI